MISEEIAAQEVQNWLAYKKCDAADQEEKADSIKALVQAVSSGRLVLNEDKSFTQKLKFSIGKETVIDTLDYKPRIKQGTIHLHLNGVKANDVDGRVCAHISALTSKPKDIIRELDTEDYKIGQSIAIFFL